MFRKKLLLRSLTAALLLGAGFCQGGYAEENGYEKSWEYVERFVPEAEYYEEEYMEYTDDYEFEEEYSDYDEGVEEDSTEQSAADARKQEAEALTKSDESYGEHEFHEISTNSMGFVLRNNQVQSQFKDFTILKKEDAEEAFGITFTEEIPSVHSLNVQQVLQNPELPTGCESVSLTMVLRYLGLNLYKTELAAEYLLYNVTDENAAIGYIGNPFDETGAGCYPPALVATAENYFIDQGYSDQYQAYDITGTQLEDLLYYVAEDEPVIVWTTMFMRPVEFTEEHGTYDGREYKWYGSEHCVVITGYDTAAGLLRINDPLEGIVTRSLDDFKAIYDEIGQYAVVVQKKY